MGQKQIQIETATISHLAEINRVEEMSFSSPWSMDEIEVELSKVDCSRTLIAYKDGIAVGYLLYWHVVDEFQINKVAVSPDYRKQGIASNLVKKIIEVAHLQKVKILVLELRKSNNPARLLYEKSGFLQVGIRKKYYSDTGDDALLMMYEVSD